MNKNTQKKISNIELFFLFFKISMFTFGGGYTIIPVIKDEFSKKRQLINEEEMLNIVAISQSGPGALAINGAILTGYRVNGFIGAITAALASALPSLIIITLISFFYKEFSQNPTIQAILLGMSGVISAILLLTSYQLLREALKKNKFFSTIMIGFSFIASFFFHMKSGLIILILASSGIIVFNFIKKEDKNDLS